MCVEAQICRTWSRALSRFHVKKPWKLHVGLVSAASKPLWDDPAGCQANANGTLQTSYEYETHICKCDGRFRIRPASWNKTKKSPKRHINRRHVGHVWTLLARFFWKYFWKPLKATFRTVNPRGLFGLAFILNPTFPPTVPPFSSFPLSFFILWKKPHHPLPHALVFIVSLSLSDLWSAAKCQTLSAFFFLLVVFFTEWAWGLVDHNMPDYKSRHGDIFTQWDYSSLSIPQIYPNISKQTMSPRKNI